MKCVPTERVRTYNAIEKEALILAKRLDQLPTYLCTDFRRGTMESGGSRGNAVRALVKLSRALDDFARSSNVDDRAWRA